MDQIRWMLWSNPPLQTSAFFFDIICFDVASVPFLFSLVADDEGEGATDPIRDIKMREEAASAPFQRWKRRDKKKKQNPTLLLSGPRFLP